MKPIDISKLPTFTNDYERVIKINRPISPKYEKAHEEVTDRFVQVTDPDSTSNVATINQAATLTNHEIQLLTEGSDVQDTIRTVDWGGFNLEKLIDILQLVAEKLSGITLFPYQSKFQRQLFRSLLLCDGARLSALFSRQCIPGDQVVYMADGSIKEIKDVRTGDEVLSINEFDEVEVDVVEDHWSTGVKERFKFKTGRGYALECSPQHLLKTPQGWRESSTVVTRVGFKNSRVGAKNKRKEKLDGEVNILRHQCIVGSLSKSLEQKNNLSKDRARLLGYLIADGCYNSSVKFTNTNELYLDDCSDIVFREFGIQAKKYSKGKGYDLLFTGDSRVAGKNELINWLRDIGIYGQTGEFKVLPQIIMGASNEVIKEFLTTFYASDGWVTSKKRQFEIGICSQSEYLAKQILCLLNRFGIGARIEKQRIAYKMVKNFWKIRISRSSDGVRFFENLGYIFGKEEPSEKAYKATLLRSKKQNYFEKNGISWDKVLHKEKLAPVEMFDIRTRKNHNFICEGYIVHNSGKSTSIRTAVPSICVCLPVFAEMFPEQLGQYIHGVFVGIFGPSGDQADIIFKGVQNIAHSDRAKQFYEAEFGTGVEKSGCKWKNGSIVSKYSAAPRANIEGQSFHLIITDESQDILEEIYGMKIRPMGAFYNAVNVFIGMVGDHPGYFYNTIEQNKLNDLTREYPYHFEADYTEVVKYNPKYRAHVEADLRDYGLHSDFFQRNYALRWKFNDGVAITDSAFKQYMMYQPADYIHYTEEPVVVGIDFASEINSSVVTVGKIKRTKFVHEDGERIQTNVQVCNWYAVEKLPYPQQRPLIKNFLNSYPNILWIAADITGVGKASFEEMQAEWEYPNMDGLVFSAESKHYLVNLFYEFFWKYQILIPNVTQARVTPEWKHFFLQWINLRKVAKKGRVVFEKAQKKTARDDYPDSLCLMLHAAKQAEKYLTDIEVIENLNIYANPPDRFEGTSFEKVREAVKDGTYGLPANSRQFRSRKLLKGLLT